MRTLVTGHDGYIGSVVVPTLVEAGHDVVGLDTGLFRSCVHGPAPAEVPALQRDIRDVAPEDLKGFDAVVHLAALSNDPLGDLDPALTFAINRDGSLRLAEAARVAGVRRFVYASSCSVYGAAAPDQLLDERAPLNPVTPYAVSKIEVEAGLRQLADDGFSPTSLRNATAYGWSPRLRCDVVLNDLVARAHLTGRVVVLSDGTPWRPLVHVKDIAAAVVGVLGASRADVHDEAFNVGDESGNHRVRRLAEIVADVVPGATVEITGETGPDPRSYRVDFSKLRARVPSFRARWTVAAGARQLYDAFRTHGLTQRQFEHDFRRLAWLRQLRADKQIDAALRPQGAVAEGR